MERHWKYFFLLLWFSYLLVSGVLLFTRGFLLNRVTYTQRSTCKFTDSPCNEFHNIYSYTSDNITNAKNNSEFISKCSQDNSIVETDHLVKCVASRTKVILIVIDALRYDFVYYDKSVQDSQMLPYQNKLTIINELLNNKPNNSKLYRFIADPPTTTMQRLKGITTGSLPTFIDVGSNFATSEINEDNILDQLRSQNKNIVFMGDDTWADLYPNRFIREFSYPSFNVWDLDSVDNGIKSNLIPEIKKNDWHLIISHFLGVDHCGHRYGPYHSEMSRKLKEMNDIIRDVVEAIDNSTILFVIGDHGMTATGDHGGDSDAEVSAAMFVYSSKPLLSSESIPHSLDVNQVDLVPTLATILGLPVPFSNLGSVILGSLPSIDIGGDFLFDWQFSLHAIWGNIEQTTNYIHHYSRNNNQFSQEKLMFLSTTYNKLQDQVASVSDMDNFKNFAHKAREYLKYIRVMCEEVWVEFDPTSISRGLLLTFLTLFFSFLIVDRLPGSVLNGKFLVVAYGGMIIAAGATVLCYFLELIQNLEQNIYFSTGIVSVFVMSIVVIQNWVSIVTNWHFQNKFTDWTNIISRILIILSLFGIFSNSYVVEEASVLYYFLLTLTWLLVFDLNFMKHDRTSKGKISERCPPNWFGAQLTPTRLKVVSLAVLLSCLLRLSRYYWRCREEQVSCESFVTRKPHSSATLVGGKYRNAECLCTLVCLALFATVARIWLRSCGNLVGFSPTVTLARYSPTVIVVCTGGFWVLQGLPKDMKMKFFLPWQLQFLPWVIYGIMGTALVSLFLQPLCVYTLPKRKENIVSVYGQESAIPQLFNQMKELMKGYKKSGKGSGDEPSPVVYGLATVYSAVFVNLGVFILLLVALLLGDVLAPSAVLMASTCIGLLTILAILQYERAILTAQLFSVPWPSVVCWGFLSVYFFYGTGHQPTFPSIQWDAAFVGTGGQFSSYLIPALLIGINTFASHLVLGLSLPLLLVAPFTVRAILPRLTVAALDTKGEDLSRGELTLFNKEDLLYQGMFTLCTKYLIFHGIRMFACMLAATIHCRHLMVWKIFAPKMIFEGLSLFITIPSVLVAYALIIRITGQVEQMFERLEKEHR